MSRGDEVGKRRRVCDCCGAPVQHPKSRGRLRRYCSSDCARDGALALRRQFYVPKRTALEASACR